MAEYYFNLPSLEDLNPAQRSAQQFPGAIALSGGPGTGKSVVSVYRHLSLTSQGKNSQLLTYTTSLALYLEKCCGSKSKIAANNVTSTFKWLFRIPIPRRTEIIVDEAQDLNIVYRRPDGRLTWKKTDDNGNELPLINVYSDYFKINFTNVSFGADNSQMLSNGTELNNLLEIFNSNQHFRLQKNYRNSRKVLRLAQIAFPDSNISENIINECKREGENPVLLISNGDKNDQDKNVIDFISDWASENAHNIGILCPWGNSVRHYYDLIKEKYPDSSFYISDNEGLKDIRSIHVCTFKSAKGLEFDTVIIPDFHKAFEDLEQFHVTWKDYYVGITRAKNNLYLISDNDLPEIGNFVTVLGKEPNFSPSEEDDLPF